MIDRTITTYTLLDSLRELGIKQLDLYVPLVCKCIVKRGAKEVTRDDLKQWFIEDYGMSKVYHGVFDSLLKKMRGKYLSVESNKFVVNLPEVDKDVQKYQQRDISADFTALLNSIQQFAKNTYNQNLTIEDVQEGVLELLHSRDGDLLFQQEKTLGVLARQQTGKTPKTQLKYVVSQFVIWSKENQPTSFSLFVKLAKGHSLTSIVTMKDVSSYTGKMRGVAIALDTPIIFNLLGLNYATNFDLDKELIEALQKQETNFILFQEHYQEVKQSLSSAIYLLTTKSYNIDKASRLLRYAVKNHISQSYLRIKLQQLDSVLKQYQITVVGAPPSSMNYEEIDLQKLEDLLVQRYSDGDPNSLDTNRRKIIATDVDVISYVYRMRGQNVATNLKNCTALLVTTNNTLAYASKHPDLSSIVHTIPVCLTDVFLSTALWFNYPDESADVNEMVLISECYQNITLSDEIIQRFYKDVERINAETPLTEEQMLDANTSEMIMEMLVNKTFNDERLYTDMTASEILDECERKRNVKLDEQNGKFNRIDSNSRRKSRTIATVIYVVLWVILAALFLFLRFVDYSSWKGWRIFINILSILPVLWGLLSWGEWIWKKINVINWISDVVHRALYKDLDK